MSRFWKDLIFKAAIGLIFVVAPILGLIGVWVSHDQHFTTAGKFAATAAIVVTWGFVAAMATTD